MVTDLVQGEFMQLGSKETENERFAHYLTKTYRKTASLIANSVKAVSFLYIGTLFQSGYIFVCSYNIFKSTYYVHLLREPQYYASHLKLILSSCNSN